MFEPAPRGTGRGFKLWLAEEIFPVHPPYVNDYCLIGEVMIAELLESRARDWGSHHRGAFVSNSCFLLVFLALSPTLE